MDGKVDILDLLAALNAGKKLILAGTLSICILAAGVSYLLPNEYEAVVQLLPPKEQKKGFGFSDLLSALPIPTLRLGEKGTPADIFVAILKSPTVRRQMVEEFGLMEVYEARKTIDALKMLEKNSTIDKSEEGTIMISVLDRDPQRATDMANRYVALLDSTNKRLARTSAMDRLGFLEKLSTSENRKMEGLTQRLEEFQAQHNAISIEEQAKAVIRAAAEMQMSAMEMEIVRQGLIASGFSPNHPEVRKAEQEIILRQQALAFLRDGTKAGDDGNKIAPAPDIKLSLRENLFLPLRQIPEVAQEYANIEKDVLVQAALMKLLLQQKAEALIEANNTTATVQILDRATVPEKKARPRRFLIVFISGILSLFASCGYTLGTIYLRTLKGRWKARYAA